MVNFTTAFRPVFLGVFLLFSLQSRVFASESDTVVIPSIQGLHSTFSFSVGPFALSSFSWLVNRSDEKVLAEMVKQVDKVGVSFFSLSDASSNVLARFDQSFSLLNSYSWQKVASIRDQQSQMLVYADMDENVVKGLNAFIIDGAEAFMVTLAGNISPEVMGRFVQSTQR